MAIMADIRRNGELHDFNFVSRKAEESAVRRYEAMHWLESVVGPLGVTNEPTEKEFLSLLRNGIILCNLINLIQPGSIPKVVENHVLLESEARIWDPKPLPAYQYFENVRNFLVAVEELKLPGFEASDLERYVSLPRQEGFEAGSAARVADCILALKAYHEWKERSGGNGVYKHITFKSPLLHSAAKNFTRPVNTEAPEPCRRLDMSFVDDKQDLTESIAKALAGHMIDSKENMNFDFLTSYENEDQDPVQMFTQILSSCLEEKMRNRYTMVDLQETSGNPSRPYVLTTSILKDNCSSKNNSKLPFCSEHWQILHSQERDLSDIKALWAETKRDFEDLQCQLMKDLNQLGRLAEELSTPALGYQKVVQENRNLYNTVQDLKGNVRVYCRIRPMLNVDADNAIASRGDDGSLVIIDPSKPRTDGRKVFQFNRVHDSMAAQVEIFKDAQPLIRSVMDGYNACILAYGQTGSGKTHTMYGPPGVLGKETGINFLALYDLFQIVNERKDIITYELYIQMVEICREEMRDLLAEDSTYQDGSNLSEITSHMVKTNTEAVNLVKRGKMLCLDVTSREMAEPSSTSHSVLTIQVQGRDSSGNILRGRLHLVDLAGSGEDDKSLATLEDVITSLSKKSSSIHYKNSKLTSLLQDALGGRAKILVFAHVIPEGDNFSKTIDTLNFVQRISTIELGAAQSNKMNQEVMELKHEIEMLRSALGDKEACDKPRVIRQRTPTKSRRLSMENPGSMKAEKRPKSPKERRMLTAETTPPRSSRMSVENLSARRGLKSPVIAKDGLDRPKEPRSPGEKPPFVGSLSRSRRLSIENPTTIRNERAQRTKEPKSLDERNKEATKRTPPHSSRRLSIENPNSVNPTSNDNRKIIETAQISRVRRLSLEGPKDRMKVCSSSAGVATNLTACTSMLEVPRSPILNHLEGPIFTDCATKFPALEPPKTPDQRQYINQHEMPPLVYPGTNILNNTQTPEIAKSANGKGSQFKKSLRTIGKLIHGSKKRNQHKQESSTKALRRQSLTGLPPPGSNRRSSLGGTSTDSRPSDNRNAKTPPVRSPTTKITKSWM